jgi:Na+/H+ antiporter NhaA
MDSKLSWQIQMGISAAVWIFIIYGFIARLSGGTYMFWVVLAILWGIGHTAELFKSIPIGKKAGVPLPVIIIKTVLFGMTWWKPLDRGIFDK